VLYPVEHTREKRVAVEWLEVKDIVNETVVLGTKGRGGTGRCTRCGSLRRDCGECDWRWEEGREERERKHKEEEERRAVELVQRKEELMAREEEREKEKRRKSKLRRKRREVSPAVQGLAHHATLTLFSPRLPTPGEKEIFLNPRLVV
jgi:hypothetical protein